MLSLAALDEKRNNGRSQITTRSVAGVNVTTLDFPIPFAYAVDDAGPARSSVPRPTRSHGTWKPPRIPSPVIVFNSSRLGLFAMKARSSAST